MFSLPVEHIRSGVCVAKEDCDLKLSARPVPSRLEMEPTFVGAPSAWANQTAVETRAKSCSCRKNSVVPYASAKRPRGARGSNQLPQTQASERVLDISLGVDEKFSPSGGEDFVLDGNELDVRLSHSAEQVEEGEGGIDGELWDEAEEALFEGFIGDEGEDAVEDDVDYGNAAADDLLRSAGYLIKSMVPGEQPALPEELKQNDVSELASEVPEDVLDGSVYNLSIETRLAFERKGHCALPGLSASEDISALAQTLDTELQRNLIKGYRQKVEVLFGADEAAAIESAEDGERRLDGVDVPFLQFFNLHESVPAVAEIALSEKVGRVAADLLGVDAVRLYQDSVFFKRSGDAATPWHADCSMMPIDGRVVTIFIPLRALGGGKHAPSLRFASGSHRDMSAAYWYGLAAGKKANIDLASRYQEEGHGAVELGGATAHDGFTLHSSPGIPEGSRPRRALSLCYVEADARVLPKEQQALLETEDSWSYGRWLSKAKAGKPLKHKLLPLVYSRDEGA